MSATIQFQAQWIPATVQYLTATGNQTITFTGGDYETNFVVMKVSSSGTLTTNSPCTIMMVEPDGSADYRDSYTFSGTLSPNNDGTTKLEFAKWVSSKNICANIHHLVLGRGLPGGSQCASNISGINASSCTSPQFSIKVESGKYSTFYFFRSMIPPLGNEFIALLKDSSLVTIIAGADILYVSKVVAGTYYRFWEPYLFAAFLYLILTYSASKVIALIEKRVDINYNPRKKKERA